MNKTFKRFTALFLTVILLLSAMSITASAEGATELLLNESITVTLAEDEEIVYSFNPPEDGTYVIMVRGIRKAMALATVYPANNKDDVWGIGGIAKADTYFGTFTFVKPEIFSKAYRYNEYFEFYVNTKAGNEINLKITDQSEFIKGFGTLVASYLIPSTLSIVIKKANLQAIDTSTVYDGIGDKGWFEFVPEESGVYSFKTTSADGADARVIISDDTGIIAKTPDMSTASVGTDDSLSAELQAGETYIVLCENMSVDDNNKTVGTCSVEVESVTSKISNVSYEKSLDTHNTFDVTVEGRPAMVQFIEPDGGTRTYDRNNKNVSIKSYDADGNEVSSLDRNLAYEAWSIYSNMSAGVEIKARAKYLNGAIYSWDSVKYSFTVELLERTYDADVRSITPSAVSGRKGAVLTSVVTGPDAEAVRFVMPNGTTTTYAASKAVQLENGDLEFTGKAWMNEVGVNTVKVQVKLAGKWQDAGAFDYTAE